MDEVVRRPGVADASSTGTTDGTATDTVVLTDDGDAVTADLTGAGFVAATNAAGYTDYTNGVLILRIADIVVQSGVIL